MEGGGLGTPRKTPPLRVGASRSPGTPSAGLLTPLQGGLNPNLLASPASSSFFPIKF